MAEANSWNEKIFGEFREDGGRIGGNFEGAPDVLVHHRGRKSGREYIPGLRRLRAANFRHPNDPGAGARSLLRAPDHA